ncbi:hypothetical protein [Nocardiopsis sp. CNT312]|uniref:hypothetical protein n=1 Tax=Nocardiopsis sp. CNT312 TaxID=1137268 RepID=UPI000685303D|nr:hypothetical protein [Nocardiopsis sp. CNT312]
MNDFDDPLTLGGADLLTEDERTVGLAYLRLAPLLQALQDQPFHARLYDDLRAYLDGPAYDAVDAFNRLRETGTTHLSERLDALDPAAEAGEWQ